MRLSCASRLTVRGSCSRVRLRCWPPAFRPALVTRVSVTPGTIGTPATANWMASSTWAAARSRSRHGFPPDRQAHRQNASPTVRLPALHVASIDYAKWWTDSSVPPVYLGRASDRGWTAGAMSQPAQENEPVQVPPVADPRSMTRCALAELKELPPSARVGDVLGLLDLEREATPLLLTHLRQDPPEILVEREIAREQDCRLTSPRQGEDVRIVGAAHWSRGNVLLLDFHQSRVNTQGSAALGEVLKQCLYSRVLGQLGGVRRIGGIDEDSVASCDPASHLMSCRPLGGLAEVTKRARIEHCPHAHESNLKSASLGAWPSPLRRTVDSRWVAH